MQMSEWFSTANGLCLACESFRKLLFKYLDRGVTIEARVPAATPAWFITHSCACVKRGTYDHCPTNQLPSHPSPIYRRHDSLGRREESEEDARNACTQNPVVSSSVKALCVNVLGWICAGCALKSRCAWIEKSLWERRPRVSPWRYFLSAACQLITERQPPHSLARNFDLKVA